jgi:hypothetical protein
MKSSFKPVLKRPWLHHVIFICYIVAPIANLLLLRAFLNVPFRTIFANLAAGYGLLATIWLYTAPIVGISLYFVKKFSWYVFLGHSGLIIADYIVKWATRPAYYLHTVQGFHNILLLTGNVALIAVVAYIIQNDFRAPYFQVLNRHWREKKRIPIYHTIALDGQPRTLNDLSTGGCFVLEPVTTRRPGDRVDLSFQSNTLRIECAGEIMRVTGTGIGIRFVRLPFAKRRDIARLLRNRFALRQKVDIPCKWVFKDERLETQMVDLSSGGCYLHAAAAGLCESSGGRVEVVFTCNRHAYSLPGQVVWVNRTGEHGKPVGFGLRFDHRQPGFMKDATIHYGLGMLVR